MIEPEEGQRWLDIVIRAFERLSSRPSLQAIYDEVERLRVATKYESNKSLEETVRNLMQRYCSTSARYGGNESYFISPARGKWRLDREAAEARWRRREEARKFLEELGLFPRGYVK